MAIVSPLLDTPIRTTLGTAGNVTEFDFPQNARRFLMRFMTNAGKVAYSGTDGAPVGSAYQTVPADQVVEWEVPGSKNQGRNLDSATRKVFLTAAVDSTVVEITALR